MLRAVRQASADLVTRSMMRSRHKRSSSSLSLSWNHKDRETVSDIWWQSHSANRIYSDTYMIHEGGELWTILNVFFQNTLDFHHFIRWNLKIKVVSIKRRGKQKPALVFMMSLNTGLSLSCWQSNPLPTLCMMPMAFILADSLLNSESWCFPSSSSSGISSSSAAAEKFIKSITVQLAEAFQYNKISNNLNFQCQM